MNDNKPSNFFDKNTITAIVLSFSVFFIWQAYVAKKYPQKPALKTAADTKQAPTTSSAQTPTAATTAAVSPTTAPAAQEAAVVTDTVLKYESEKLSFDLSSQGMGFKNLTIKNYTDRAGNPITYAQEGFMPLAASLVNGQNNFKISQTSANEFSGLLMSADGQLRADKKIVIDTDKYIIHTTITVTSSQKQIVNVKSLLEGTINEVKSSMFLPSYEHQDFFILDSEKEHRHYLSLKEPFKESYNNSRVAGLNSQYFSLALVNKSDLLPATSAETQEARAQLTVSYQNPEPVDQQTISYDFYYGPKQIDTLKSSDQELAGLIDYGFFGFIGKPLHALLLFIFGLVKNWGLAIVVLTVFLRTVLLPLNLYSFKSMKKMQAIQPKLAAIKEKYKNDPARVNQETLQLMRSEKANPLSGCIPALMQIPIFFAFYAMIASSFELYKQPFYLWIMDLTLKDPFYVLPVAGSLVFFIQQKLTPPSPGMDPAQQKVLLFMPLFITVFMLGTPSGLSLYFFVNALCGFAQQMFFMKSRAT